MNAISASRPLSTSTRFTAALPPADADRPVLARHLTVALLLAQFAAMWIAFFILAPSIDWPASLGQPASVMLPMLAANSGAVFTGYLSYLLHALLLIPLAVTLRHSLHMGTVVGGIAVALGVLAGFAKALGITRWLFLMPELAAGYLDPAASEVTRAAITVVFDAFNAYAGGVGELLGVGLFAGLWTVLLSIALLRLGSGARLIGFAGLFAAAMLFTTLPSVVGIESAILLTLSGIVWQLWTAALAIWLLRARSAR